MPGYKCLKFLLVLLLVHLFATNAVAGDTLYFKGKIKVSKNVSYDYSLRFTVDSKSQLTGYSLSDPGGPNETKTRIFGTYDSSNNIVSYEEKAVLRSKVDLQKNYLCFVKASLKLKKTNYLETLSGKFTGIEPGKSAPCATGDIKLINTDKVKVFLKLKNPPVDSIKTETAQIKNDKVQKIPEEKDKNLPIIKSVEPPINSTPVKQENTVMISDDKGKEFSITGNKIKLTVWDNGEVDGDRISILLNDKYILENYTVTFSAKIIEATLSDREMDTIKIIALNEGNLPPNTAAIRIESATEQYPIITKANLNEVRTIYLRKKIK